MAYEALYRRYRPSRFQDAFFGQEHVVAALRNAVEGDRVGHAYLFSGPRGTGKTTSARILAKALNCTNLQGGEPCNTCDSCEAFQAGGSYDLHELDAASNNGVDAMRDLIGKVALGSPGRTKVYILDEVHMLSSGAENALLKTLEEPPPHVVFVLCTTEPNKVVPTIRSRTQHLEFSLLSADQVAQLVDYVVSDAGIEITAEDRAYVIRAGGGSARDTLSALDQVVAAGGAPQGGEHLEALFQSLIDRSPGDALAAIDGALQAGRDAAGIATALLHELRTVFLAAMHADVNHLPEAERDRATHRAAAMAPARVTRAIEVLGASVIEMRQAPDPRVDLEVAVMRLTRPDLDTDPAAILERLEAIEGQLAGGPRAPLPAQAADASAQPPAADPPAAASAPEEPARPNVSAESAPLEPANAEPAVTPDAAPVPPVDAVAARPRGADIARAELRRQGLAGSDSASASVPQPTSASAEAPPQTVPAAPASGKTLADVRRERQAAAQATGTAQTAEVDAAAQARRERQAAAQAPAPSSDEAPESSAPSPRAQADPVRSRPSSPQARADVEPPSAEQPVSAEPRAATSSGAVPDLAALSAVWQSLLESMSGRVRSRFSAGHFLESTADSALFGLPNPVHRDRCEEVRAEVDAALAGQFGRPIPLRLVVDETEEEPDFFATAPSGGSGAEVDVEVDDFEEESVDVHDLVDATGDVPSAADRVMATFEGSTLLEDHPPNQYPDR